MTTCTKASLQNSIANRRKEGGASPQVMLLSVKLVDNGSSAEVCSHVSAEANGRGALTSYLETLACMLSD